MMGRAILIDLNGVYRGVYLGDTGYIGQIDSVQIITPTPPTPTPTDPGQLICVRPWACSLDESDADLIIRESMDFAKSKIPYITVLPGVLDQRRQPHPAIEAYRKLVPDRMKAHVFHVAPTTAEPAIINQGPLDADAVLGWIDVPKVDWRDLPRADADEDAYLDVDFAAEAKQQPERLGWLREPEILYFTRKHRAVNIRNVPGFSGIPRSQWGQWTSRFPVERLAKSIRHISDQDMGSCVGHSGGNTTERGCYTQAGDLYFRKLSFQHLYSRISGGPNTGAYVGDAADELESRGILPADGEKDIDGNSYPHTHHVSSPWGTRHFPSGWESTALAWRSRVFKVDSSDTESAFRLRMDCRLNEHFGRSRHAISGFGVTANGRWAYENSWGNWGDLGKCVGYDSRHYSSWCYQPVLRDEIEILVASELHQLGVFARLGGLS